MALCWTEAREVNQHFLGKALCIRQRMSQTHPPADDILESPMLNSNGKIPTLICLPECSVWQILVRLECSCTESRACSQFCRFVMRIAIKQLQGSKEGCT